MKYDNRMFTTVNTGPSIELMESHVLVYHNIRNNNGKASGSSHNATVSASNWNRKKKAIRYNNVGSSPIKTLNMLVSVKSPKNTTAATYISIPTTIDIFSEVSVT
jgi:hypothetical protein